MASPMSGMLYAHKAIRGEAEALESAAARLAAADDELAEQLAGRVGFFRAVLRGHQDGEERVLWPALDATFPHVSTSYTLDHRAEDAAFEKVERLLAEYSGARSEEGRLAVARQLTRELIGLNMAVGHHSRKEDSHLVPLVQEHFTMAEQAEMAGRMVAHLPQDLMPRIAPWAVRNLPGEDRAGYVTVMMRAMPPEKFQTTARWVQEGIPAEDWAELVARIPELASFTN